VLGYHIEVAARHADKLMAEASGFTHRQTLAGAVRFNSPELHDEASRVVEAGGHALAARSRASRGADRACARRLFERACHRRFARPDRRRRKPRPASGGGRMVQAANHSSSPCLEIDGGRHPVVESALSGSGERFVANDLKLGPDDRLWLITGPEHGRQVDLP
jgi:DNA mismatch repair protein MutS